MEEGHGRPPSRWDALNSLRTMTVTKSGNLIKEILRIVPVSLIYRKLGDGEAEANEDDGQPESRNSQAIPHAGVVQLQAERAPLKQTDADDEEESSDEEIESLQRTASSSAAGGSGGMLFVSQPHQWEKTDFATFTWCKYCGKHLFPLSSGFTCKRGCNYTVHKGRCAEAASKFECYAVDAKSRSRQESHLDTFENQVGGHKGKAAFLKDLDGGKILKPLCPVEFQFYSLLVKLAAPDQHEAPGIPREEFEQMKAAMKDPSVWEDFFPRFYGVAQTSEGDDSATEHFIVMEDLTAGYSRPCICDLKIGARGYDDKASTKKVLQQKLLCSVTTSSTLFFRMCGMQYWQKEQKSYVVRDKLWGCKLKDHTMQGALVQFLDNGDGVRFPLIVNWLSKLKRIEKWFEEQTLFTFYSSSILLIYDGSAPKECTDQTVLKADVRMIDFAHTHPNAHPGTTRDDNYLNGLRSVIRMLEDILRPVLTIDMLSQLGYDPTVAAHPSRSGEDENENTSILSGTFDIRNLFHRRRARTPQMEGSSDDASLSGSSSVNASGLLAMEDSEEGVECGTETRSTIPRVLSAPHSLVALEQECDDEVKSFSSETEPCPSVQQTRFDLSSQKAVSSTSNGSTSEKRRRFSLSLSPKPSRSNPDVLVRPETRDV